MSPADGTGFWVTGWAPAGLLDSYQAVRAMANAKTALAAAGARLDDVVQWTVLIVTGADLRAAYGAIAPQLASDEPALVTAAQVAGLGVPGALVEISAVAAVLR